MSKLIIFEGVDGTGKTTAVKIASDYLSSINVPHICTKEPYYYEIMDVCLNKLSLLNPNRVFFAIGQLYLARKLHVEKKIIPALDKGLIVLCDRFIESTFAYQGMNSELLDFIENLYPDWGNDVDKYLHFYNDVTWRVFNKKSILIICNQKQLIERIEKRGENENLYNLISIQKRYLKRCAKKDIHNAIYMNNNTLENFSEDMIKFIKRSI